MLASLSIARHGIRQSHAICHSIRSWRRLVTTISAVFLFASQGSSAQEVLSPPLPNLEFTTYTGVAVHSPVGKHLGIIPNRDHLFLGIHPTWMLAHNRRWSIHWAPEVALLLVSDNPTYQRTADPEAFAQYEVPGGLYVAPGYVAIGQNAVAGFAVSPVGVEGQLRTSTRWRLYAAGAAGAVWFTRDVPLPGTRAFNFTFEFGGGAICQLTDRSALRIGYKFHHLSNAYTVPVNPGLDANVWVVGWQHTFGRKRSTLANRRSATCGDVNKCEDTLRDHTMAGRTT